MTDAILSVRNLRVSYGKVEAVHDVSLALSRDAIVTVIGANGAGKSTLLNAIMGLLPSTGSVRLEGVEQSVRSVPARVTGGLSLVPERRELFGSMTVEDNLLLGGYKLIAKAELPDALASIYDRFPPLKTRRLQLAATLSGGERQMLAMGRALISRPRVLMLDEPSLGLAPRIVQGILQIIVNLRSIGVSTLLVEQNAKAALEIASYAYVMELGEITAHGPAKDLLTDDRIIESYLGSHAAAAQQRAASAAH